MDRVIPHGDDHLLSVLGIGLLAMVLFHGLASLIRSHLLLYLRTHLDSQMTLGFLEHLVSLPYAFFQQRAEGDLLMRVNSNAQIREMLTSSTLAGLLDGPLASVYLVILLHGQSGPGGPGGAAGDAPGGRLPAVLPPLSGTHVTRFADASQSAKLSRAHARRDRDLEGERS